MVAQNLLLNMMWYLKTLCVKTESQFKSLYLLLKLWYHFRQFQKVSSAWLKQIRYMVSSKATNFQVICLIHTNLEFIQQNQLMKKNPIKATSFRAIAWILQFTINHLIKCDAFHLFQCNFGMYNYSQLSLLMIL